MAMMTGRVLLVCALCVLWCGAAVAVLSADGAGVGDGSAGEYLPLQWRTRFLTECAEEVGRRTGGRANASSVEECVRQVMESLHAAVDGRSRWRRQLSAVAVAAAAEGGGKENPNTVEGEKTSETLATSGKASTGKKTAVASEQTSVNPAPAIVPPARETLVQGKHNETNAKEEKEEEGGEKDDSEEEEENHKEDDEEEDAEEGEKAEEREEDKKGEESEKNTKEEEAKYGVEEDEEDKEKDDDNTSEGMPAVSQEKRNSTSGPEGAPNKTNTEGTQTPGDIDGSTAVSHTTSPLLLLVVVSAAAAVVAA
ncbi:Mucin-associated surface protein (MASP) [Trypanosoma cruzi]|uniref:Mucin-associated surface protein (MASP) n=1 Tax=Trypanosoma cruzi TaxID=5693 RepID=A0A2V2VE88_TRYCR|nr:Mucin-associated surface protein (MASP) [Trypanosoma cruzi]